MKKCLAVVAVLAALLSIGEVSLAKSDVLEATELNGWYFRNDDTLAFYDLDGGARTTFLMKLNDGQTAIASFSWAVKPGARPSSSKTVLIVGGKVKESKSHLVYDLQSISGTISTSKSVYSVEVAKSDIKRIEIWSPKSRQYIFSEFDNLMAPLPLKVAKPQP